MPRPNKGIYAPHYSHHDPEEADKEPKGKQQQVGAHAHARMSKNASETPTLQLPRAWEYRTPMNTSRL